MRTKSLVIFLILFLIAGNIYAGGAELNVVTRAKTLSLNGLYFAGSDGLNSVLGNPAGLTLTDKKYIEFSIADMIGQQQFEGDSKGLHKSFEEDHFAIDGGLAWSFSPDFAMALCYQRAINYNVSWPFLAYQSTDSTSSISAFDLYNSIKIDAASISGSFRFSGFSIGVTLTAYQVKQETAFPQENLSWYDSASTGLAAYQFKYNEDAWTFGFGLGMLYQFTPDLQIGLMARSGYSADLSGTAESQMFADLDSSVSKVDLSSKIEMPWIFGGGLVYHLNESLIINADLQYSMWSSTQESIKYDFNNPVWQNNVPAADTLSGISADKSTLDFRNSIDAGVGLEYLLSDIKLRLGYRYSQSPNSESTYSYLYPCVNQNWISLGLGYEDKNLSADLTIAYAFGINKEITHSKTGFNGTYDSNLVYPAITIHYTF